MAGREEATYEKLAWVTAYLLQPWTEESLSVNRLLGRPDGSPESIESLIGTSGDALYERVMARQRGINGDD